MALHNGYGFRWRDLESQRKSGASARNLGGLRVTCPLYADNVARLASGRSLVEGGEACFFQDSSERPPLKGVPGLSIWWRALRKLRELPGELHGLHR